MRLEIGGGTNRREGYENIDLNPAHASRPEFVLHLGVDRIPLTDCSVEAAFASHLLEHIPQGEQRIFALNEIWRVLVPGGPFEIIVPCIGYTNHASIEHVPEHLPDGERRVDTHPIGEQVYAGWQGWADPTHVSHWWFPESFWYLDGTFAANADYGLRLWRPGTSELRDGWEAHVTLIKP